jgi:hypothetical protein
MSLRSCLASGARLNFGLRADIWAGLLAAAKPIVDFAIDLVEQLRRKRNTLSPVELVDANLKLGAELLQALTLIERLERLLDDLVGGAIATCGDLLLNSVCQFGGKRDAHRENLLASD